MPGLRGALAVRVSDGQSDRIVTRYCRGLKFTKVAPGGHMSLSFTMVLPRNTFNDLGPEDRVYVYDGRTARTIWEGYLENPTPVDGPDGQQYEVSAMGGMVRASDETRGLIYITSDLSDWEQDSAQTFTSGSQEQFGSGLRLQFTSGNTVANSVYIGAKNNAFVRAGMTIGAISLTDYSGKVDANYSLNLNNSGLNFPVLGDTTPRLTTTHVADTKWVGTDLTAPSTYLVIYVFHGGLATNVTDDLTWSQLDSLTVLGQRMDRNGTLLTGSAGLVSATQVLASQVVEDLLGRVLTFCDAGTAQVDTTTFGITQLSYPEGVKAADVLAALAVYEPGYLWEILETLDSGKHRFNYRAWPTTARYIVSVRDGWQQQGSDVDLCNRIIVTYKDPVTGLPTPVTVTAASLGLTGIGLPVDALGTRVKDADPVTLPDGQSSSANATRIGGQILTDKINPPKAGSVVVRRPILDLLTGAMVMPWEIEPGYLCRVRETGDDLRITQADYDDDSCSMALTLGTPVLTIDQRLARLDRTAA